MRPVILLAVVPFLLAGCGDGAATSDTETPKAESSSTNGETATVAEPELSDVLAKVNAGEAVLLDVRTAGEWDSAHFAKAVHLPVGDISEEKAASIDKAKPVYVHCAAGKRAVTGAEALVKLGFNAVPLKTSYDSIKDAGFEEAK